MAKKKQNLLEERIDKNLEYLKLSKMQGLYKEYGKKSCKDNLSHLQFLDHLINEEATAKFERRVAMLIKRARLPFQKTLDAYDFNFPKKIPKSKVLQLTDLGFVEEKINGIFVGPPGVGKSHLILSIAHLACQQGISTLFATAIEIVNDLNAS